MYLRSICLKGFKSFAKKTELLLEPGVAVVIGPNGSGKSNLAEAVMWALGEQSPTTMRGASMQDVIFAGSDGRRASGGAEVELVFDNSDGALPLSSLQVSVSRRVQRDGQSSYRVNQAACRLTDVVELMSAVGLGKELHSIIGQGKVESFLSSKPSERRALVEEAAGLGRYKRRRERSVLKLRETQRNLERALDLEREIGAQLAPLRRQASAAEQLRATQRELDEARGRLLAGELAGIDLRLDETGLRLEGLKAEREHLEAELGSLADRRVEQEEHFARVLRERERRAQRVLRARSLSGRIETCRRLTEQRVRLFDEVVRADEAERDRLMAELRDPPEKDDAWPQERAALNEVLQRAEADHTVKAERLAAARGVLAERRAERGKLIAEREELQLRTARLGERRAALGSDLTGLRRRSDELASQLQLADAEAAAATAAQTAAEETEAAAGATLRAAAEAEHLASADLSAIDARRVERAAELAAAQAEADHLSASLQTMQEVDDDILAVARRYQGVGSLARDLRCDPGYQLALSAALARHSGGLSASREEDGWSLLGALRDAGVRVARVVLPLPARQTTSRQGLAADPLLGHVQGATGRVLELIAETIVVEDLRGVPKDYDGLAVTREGTYYRPSAGEIGIAAGIPVAVLLERRARLQASERRCRDARQASDEAAEAAAGARAAVRVAAHELSQCERRAYAARQAVVQARRAATALLTRLADMREQNERVARQADSHVKELSALDAEIRELEACGRERLTATEALAVPLAAAEAAALRCEEEHERTLAALTRCRVELEERTAGAQRRAHERKELERRARAGRERLVVLQRRLAAVPVAAEAARELLDAVAVINEQAVALAQRLEASDGGQDGLPNRDEMRALAAREAELRRLADEVRERRLKAEIEAARLDERRVEVAAAAEEIAARLEIAHFDVPADDAERAELARVIERCERRMERIGPVNPLAEAECQELGERAAFLREQRRDLERSLRDLDQLIVELTERIDAGFAETFSIVQEHFARMIGTLFPGGGGRLSLTVEEGEEAGVAMEVKPGRKLGKRLTMLSGGERSLAAIAFLMSLMLARPSPFYILDEIEAALDDVNIGRFVAMLRDYREKTQFIIITHQKRTMEAADILYGVTMGDDASSHVVSARMAEEEIDRQAREMAGKVGG